jgi:hypothetical protein
LVDVEPEEEVDESEFCFFGGVELLDCSRSAVRVFSSDAVDVDRSSD